MPFGRTNSSMVADDPIAMATLGDGICRSKSNAVAGAAEVVVTAGKVVVGTAVVVEAPGATVSGTSVAATIGAVVVVGVVGVVGLVGAGASTTLFLTIVVAGPGFAIGFALALTGLLSGFFATCFLIGAFVVAVPIAALDLGALKKDSALTTSATEANGARNRRD
jgi:hypothetical protein